MAVQWSAAHCGGAWIIDGYDEVASALRDPRFSVRRAARWINSGLERPARDAQAGQRFKRLFSRSLLFLDGRAHRRLRGQLHAGFKPEQLAQQRPVIARLAAQLVADITADPGTRQGFDFVTRFARPLPARVIASLLGLPARVPAAFIDWAADLATFIGSPTPNQTQTLGAQQAMQALCDYFDALLCAPAQLARDGLVAQLLQARQQQRLTQTELLAQCATLLFAGYETTRNLLGNGVLALLRHPDQWTALQTQLQAPLQAQPQAWRGAVREMLRYDSPVQYTGRRLVADVTLAGQPLRRGDLAILHIGRANHDTTRFRDAGSFDIARDEGMHLSFGQGPHVCLGAALTQMEAEIAFAALLRAFPALALGAETPRWQQDGAYRALERLVLTY